MADLSRKLISQGVERLISKEIKRVTNADLDVGEIAGKVVGVARRVMGIESEPELPEPLTLSESVVALAKSVHSFGDLERRISAHRRDFARVYKHAVRDLAQVLTAMSDPEHRPASATLSAAHERPDGPYALGEGERLDEDR